MILILVLVLILIWQVCAVGKETMTRIRRTVGVYNDANEIQVAAGVVNSVPIMDYTYTYWDGQQVTSCDECPNATVCPHCPNMSALGATDTSHEALLSAPDAAEFAGSRAGMGAASGAHGMGSGSAMNVAKDSYCAAPCSDGLNCNMMRHGIYCTPSRPIVNFLYGNTDYPASAPACTFYNKIGYQYKEPCMYTGANMQYLAQRTK